jgi:hypothetical protein
LIQRLSARLASRGHWCPDGFLNGTVEVRGSTPGGRPFRRYIPKIDVGLTQNPGSS